MAKWKGNIISFSPQATSGTAYTGKANGIWSCDILGQLKQSGLWALGITPPSAPNIGTATAGNAQVSIAFTAPSSLNGETVTSYTVTSSGGQSVTGSSSPIVVTGLSNGTSYTFTINANSASGASAGASVSATPSSQSVPGIPTIGTATISSASSAMITFTAPTSNGGTVITSYTAVSSPGGITGTLSQAGSGTITVNGLAQLTTYTFTVYATNSVGNSSNSTATGSISMPAIDPYFSSVSLLLSGDGANGVNNFTDLSIGSRTVTTYGNTQVSTSVKKFGTGSIYFDGLGDYLRCATNITLSANFTVEFWFNVTAASGYHRFFNNEYEGGKYFYCYYNGTGIVAYNVDSASLGIYGTFTANTWNHFAIVRLGSTSTLYLNGTSVASWSGSTSFPFTYTQLSSDGEEMQGYLDDFRITNGVARYTSNFTPSNTASPLQ